VPLTPGQKEAAALYLSLLGGVQPLTRDHVKRVAKYSARVAKALGKDVKAAYLGGLYHDVGKISIDSSLFIGRDVSLVEYDEIKTHASLGRDMLKGKYEFTSLVAGLHHNMCIGGGYGIDLNEIPGWSLSTVKKVLDISTVVSVCDFIDAYQTRKTTMIGGSAEPLAKMLYDRFSNDRPIVDKALEVTCAQ
jgi:putative nucleotidyltransferase with HDIG domain